MAKSLRSKWRRKMRAVKRERYGKKELERLKTILGIEDGQKDIEMKSITEIATVTDVKTVQQECSKGDSADSQAEEMEHDQKRLYNKKTLKDQFGSYPVWMNHRQIKRKAKQNRDIKKKMKKKQKRKK
ncbi:protein LLP homolog [Anabrus simplex]|uniref:protein LLP homolog n=1 Tax=Anabrus simplex TaxID=316456 RepID=UPI0034DD81F9